VFTLDVSQTHHPKFYAGSKQYAPYLSVDATGVSNWRNTMSGDSTWSETPPTAVVTDLNAGGLRVSEQP